MLCRNNLYGCCIPAKVAPARLFRIPAYATDNTLLATGWRKRWGGWACFAAISYRVANSAAI